MGRAAPGPAAHPPAPPDLHRIRPTPVRSGGSTLNSRLAWVDGQLASLETPLLRADDLAFREGRGCYTAALVVRGRVRAAERHARRLARDAASIGIAPLDENECLRAFEALAHAVFPDRDGIVRLQASCDAGGGIHLTGTTREVGDDPVAWRAVSTPFAHPGPLPFSRVKVTNHLLFAYARARARDAGVEEAVLFDGDDRLVEGSRSNLFVVDSEGRLVTPPLARGAVLGVGREIVTEAFPEVIERDVARSELATVRELIGVSGVRAARPIVELDGKLVARGHSGPWAARLARAIETDG